MRDKLKIRFLLDGGRRTIVYALLLLTFISCRSKPTKDGLDYLLVHFSYSLLYKDGNANYITVSGDRSKILAAIPELKGVAPVTGSGFVQFHIKFSVHGPALLTVPNDPKRPCMLTYATDPSKPLLEDS